MLNQTSFTKVVFIKIIKGINEANKNGIAHVLNRKGKAFLAIRKRIVNGKVFFQILDNLGRNVRGLMYSSISRFLEDRTLPHTVLAIIVSRVAYSYELKAK